MQKPADQHSAGTEGQHGRPPEPDIGTPTPIDVVIPVYTAVDETRHCITSVLKTRQTMPFELIVIDDASPEPELKEYLTTLQAQTKITLLSNPKNLGFTRSANIGIGLHPQRDVVLLHSDTEVYGNWLDRLHRAAYCTPRVGTVTPFSNHAGTCSYPRYRKNNAIPPDWHPAMLDSLCAEINADRQIEIPTAIGFCVYLTRAGLDKVGPLDTVNPSHWEKPEIGFCMRLRAHNFKNLLTGDVFVYHRGNQSRNNPKRALTLDNQPELERLDPSYRHIMMEHIKNDPERALRRRLDISRLQRSHKPRILFVTHSQGGGTERHVQELSSILATRYDIFVLRPTGTATVILDWAAAGEEFHLYFSMDNEFSGLIDTLNRLGVSRIHFHHLIHQDPRIWKLAEILAIPYDFTIHDYYCICPQITLTNSVGSYCGEPDEEGCTQCLGERPAPEGLSIGTWRERYFTFLSGAQRIFVPSDDVRQRITKYFSIDNIEVLPHPQPPLNNEIRVVIIGRISTLKGAKQVIACARDAKYRKLPISFIVVGILEIDRDEYTSLPVFTTGLYKDSELDDLIVQQRPDIIYFPAQWPETYSYTLDAAIRTRLPILAPRLGAFPERLKSYPCGTFIDYSERPDRVNNLLMQLAICVPQSIQATTAANVLTLPTISKRIENDQARD